ncbi:HD-GYP domain-containing protein [Aliikangiella coralliicola]|uniref:DUF3391 domain-containing protein n=1 Tax=Aliikangiella coralliicola TaxID=2592383 RepID=A0A545UEK0_9GAMM|nr:HD-GYP domain-containing protein [Aliikangiella coralliicola]TQV87904.1 DUF3391 domain-containing protein [Aliikangiella coralliicola]
MSKHIETRRLNVAELRIGMYVTRLETPWSATEFPLEGVLIKSREDILKISRYGKQVEIDQAKSLSGGQLNLISQIAGSRDSSKKRNQQVGQVRPWRKFCTQSYSDQRPISKEIAHAYKLLQRADQLLNELKPGLKNINAKFVSQISTVSDEIVASLIESPDALLWLTKVKVRAGKVYDHVVRTSIWATLMGRSMGVQRSSLSVMNQAILLSSVGKSYLRKNDWLAFQGAELHPDFAKWSQLTLEKLSHCRIEPRVLTIIANMTERFDGSGFPQQKSGKAIPYLSQVAGLAEAFDLILHPMLTRKRRTVGQVLSRLYCYRDSAFDGELIEELIQATGLYPPGTQVLLSSGCSGIVVEQSKDRRIRATVALTHDPEGYRLLSYKIIRLGEGDYKDVIIRQEGSMHKVTEDDLQRINQEIRNYQRSRFAQAFSGLSGIFN